MKIIDAHQHFWQYDPINYSWINDEMQVIRKDFLPADLHTLYQSIGVTGCVAVQAEQTMQETERLIAYAQQYDFIKGVVGWIDICDTNIVNALQQWKHHRQLKGFRHVLQGEAPEFMLQDAFINGLHTIHQEGYTYDILVFPHHLDAVLQLLDRCPGHRFVIDHVAKPLIRQQEINEWAAKMKAIAAHPNVYCKISGMITEAHWDTWQPAHLHPYLDVVVAAFGTQRIMFGSDWPVCLVAGSYRQWLKVVQNYFSGYSFEEQERFFAGNAITFYQL